MPSPGPSTSAAPMSSTRRCRSPSRSFSPTMRPASISTRASSPMRRREALAGLVEIRDEGHFAQDIAALGAAHRTVRLDQATAAHAIGQAITANGGKVSRAARSDRADEGGEESCRDRRQPRAASARRRGGGEFSGLVRSRRRRAGQLTEIDAVEALESFRRDTGLLRTCRFRPFPAPVRTAPSCIIASPAKPTARIVPGDLFLIDSGAQYRGRHHRYHPHRRWSANPTPRCATVSPACSRAISRSPARCFPKAPAGATRQLRPASLWAGRARFRPRHRPRRRQLSLGA